MENPVSMSSGDSLQDWSSDSISSHQTQVRSPAVQKLQLQLAQALIALSLINYIILFVFLTWYVIFFLGGGGEGEGEGVRYWIMLMMDVLYVFGRSSYSWAVSCQ